MKIFTHYGLYCVLCGEPRLGALHIDHIDGNGKAHRQQITNRNGNKHCIGGNGFYAWLHNQFKLSGYWPVGYRTLCANCNVKEHLSNKRLSLSMSKEAIRSRAGTAKTKQQVMAKLGGVCTECGKDDIDILTVHHVNNNGAEHRRTLNSGRYYVALLKADKWDDLECRCFSCNDNAEYLRRRQLQYGAL